VAGLTSAGIDRRSRGRAYLLLARVSNIPTVWSNVLAGAVGAVAATSNATPMSPLTARSILWPLLAGSCFYTGGMILNDAFDERFDRVHRPERPIPRGDVGSMEAFAVGGVCLVAGIMLLRLTRDAAVVGLLLSGAILLYDYSHKRNPVAPIVMGSCRGLLYAAAAASVGRVSFTVVAGGIAVAAYVAGLTIVARRAGADARWLVPALIAGISLLDALFIAIVAPPSWPLAVLAALGCPLTLFLQRFVPGD
jgi:4-hydroxybenzoate polyprenyltransferase